MSEMREGGRFSLVCPETHGEPLLRPLTGEPPEAKQLGRAMTPVLCLELPHYLGWGGSQVLTWCDSGLEVS